MKDVPDFAITIASTAEKVTRRYFFLGNAGTK